MKNLLRILSLLALALAAPLRGEEPQLPPEAVALLPAGRPVPTKPKPDEGKIESVESAGAPVNPVFRVTSPGKLSAPHVLAVSRTFEEPIAAGQVCLFVIKARTVESAGRGGLGKVSAAVQNRADYKKTPLWKSVAVGKEWETIFFAFQPENPAPAGQGVAKIVCGDQQQVVEIADFQVYRFPVGFDIFSAPRMRATYEGRELDAPWRKEAEARIEKLRKGDLTVRVVDADGKPVPGAKVRVEMKRHLFGFGSAVDVNMLSGLDAKISPADQAKYRDTVDALFSRIVPENGLRVRNIDKDSDPARPWDDESRRRTKAAVLWTLQWAQDRKMTSRGHYLLWCYLEKWAQDEVAQHGVDGLLATYRRHWKFVVPLVKDYVAEWDALNHPVPFDEKDALYNVVGPTVYADLFKEIRPLTTLPLFVNEDTFNPDRADGFEKHVRRMIELGAVPDGAGFQSHYHDYTIPSIDDVWHNYERMGELVKQLTVTEYDFQSLDDQLHADHLRDMLTLAFSHPQMTGFVMWGFWEGRHWKPTAAMFRKDWTERPAVQVWRDLVLGKWWTREQLTTDANGEAKLRGFYGWYDVTAEAAGKTTTQLIKHAASGGRPTLTLK